MPPEAYSGNNTQTMYINPVNMQNETISITGNVFLKNDVDRFDVISTITTLNSGLATNYSSEVKFGWTFKMYYRPDTSEPR